MDLKKFTSLTINSALEAKKFIGLLIGNLPPTDEVAEAIIGFYESLDSKIKKDNETLAPIFRKFFLIHPISENNFKYYEKFSSYWNDSARESIIKNNPQWKFPQYSFKHSDEFAKSFNTYRLESFENIQQFLEKNKYEMERFIKENKDGFCKSMIEYGGWQILFKKDFDFFKDFCSQYEYNKLKVVKSLVADSSHGLKSYIIENDTDPKSIEFILNNTKPIFKNSDFFNQYSGQYCNALDTFLIFFFHGHHDWAFKIYNQYEKELTSLVKSYILTRTYLSNNEINQLNIGSEQTWEKFIDSIERASNYFTSENFAIKTYVETIELIKKIPNVIKYKDLDLATSKDNNKTDKPKMKI